MRVEGRVVRGVGESGKFLSIDWVTEEMTRAFDFTPFPGTLNLTLDDPRAQEILKERAGMRLVARTEGFCDAILVKAVLNGHIECGIVIPLVKDYDGRLLEVVAPVHLKETLHIDDGDVVTLDLDMDLTHHNGG